MSHLSSTTDCRVSSAQVWARLAAEYRARVIRLMAQLAFNLVVAQADSPIQESVHAVSTEYSQDPT
jgi:hypothetical protein